eukprot:351542-Chlamydomonas_euryale.AAC.3
MALDPSRQQQTNENGPMCRPMTTADYSRPFTMGPMQQDWQQSKQDWLQSQQLALVHRDTKLRTDALAQPSPQAAEFPTTPRHSLLHRSREVLDDEALQLLTARRHLQADGRAVGPVGHDRHGGLHVDQVARLGQRQEVLELRLVLARRRPARAAAFLTGIELAWRHLAAGTHSYQRAARRRCACVHMQKVIMMKGVLGKRNNTRRWQRPLPRDA